MGFLATAEAEPACRGTPRFDDELGDNFGDEGGGRWPGASPGRAFNQVAS